MRDSFMTMGSIVREFHDKMDGDRDVRDRSIGGRREKRQREKGKERGEFREFERKTKGKHPTLNLRPM